MHRAPVCRRRSRAKITTYSWGLFQNRLRQSIVAEAKASALHVARAGSQAGKGRALTPCALGVGPRSFAKPPKQVQTVCECILIMRGYKELNWKTAKGMMSEANFLRSLMEIDFDSITQTQVKSVRGERPGAVRLGAWMFDGASARWHVTRLFFPKVEGSPPAGPVCGTKGCRLRAVLMRTGVGKDSLFILSFFRGSSRRTLATGEGA